MKSSGVIILFQAIALIVLGCTRAVKVEEVAVEVKAPEPVKEEIVVEKPPKVEIEERVPDYEEIELEVTDLQKVEEPSGSYNSYNPKFSYDEKYLSFEANLEMYKKIYIYLLGEPGDSGEDGRSIKRLKEVYLEERLGETFSEDLFESSFQESYNYEFSWFPQSSAYIFTSNAGMGDYNLYIGAIEEEDPVFRAVIERLRPKPYSSYFMMTEEIRKDGQAKVSPDGKRIVFTSGRTGNGDLYLLDLFTGELRRLTYNEETDLFPQWSPDGNDIVYTTGSKHSHDIHIIRGAGKDTESHEALVKWFFDDVMPNYSPDGKMISFYTTYNRERDPFNTKRWGLMIIPSDGSAPGSGNELIEFFHMADVVKDNSQATAWFPDSRHICFAKNIETDYNPIYIYDVEMREARLVETETDINHDITVSPHGLLSFRAQVLGWDKIFIASTTYFQEYEKLNFHKIVD